MIRSQSQRAQLRGNDGEDDNLECKQTDPATHQYETNSRVHIEVLAGWCWGIHLSLCMSWSTPISALLVYPCKHACSSSAYRMPGHLGWVCQPNGGMSVLLSLIQPPDFCPIFCLRSFPLDLLVCRLLFPNQTNNAWIPWLLLNMRTGLNNIMFQLDQLADVALSGW